MHVTPAFAACPAIAHRRCERRAAAGKEIRHGIALRLLSFRWNVSDVEGADRPRRILQWNVRETTGVNSGNETGRELRGPFFKRQLETDGRGTVKPHYIMHCRLDDTRRSTINRPVTVHTDRLRQRLPHNEQFTQIIRDEFSKKRSKKKKGTPTADKYGNPPVLGNRIEIQFETSEATQCP